jgi:hypothetical protein
MTSQEFGAFGRKEGGGATSVEAANMPSVRPLGSSALDGIGEDAHGRGRSVGITVANRVHCTQCAVGIGLWVGLVAVGCSAGDRRAAQASPLFAREGIRGTVVLTGPQDRHSMSAGLQMDLVANIPSM